MRNLKRALSLALASVMLLGMMVMSTSAASNFADANDIVNTEAVEITAGLGLFAGTDGRFLPKGTVTRAQMATIIVKMLHGSDFNADSFKGVKKFTDVASFESGWAEGYVNLCANLGIVGGYGDGTFRPGQAVTTAEAITMIINALKVDAGAGTWPLTVMAKAEEIKLFEDLSPKPGTNVALTRDELAVVVLNGIQYSPDGKTGYIVGDETYEDYLEAYLAAGMNASLITAASNDSLATKVFQMKTAEGFITANQATGLDVTQLNDSADAIFNIETGLDMIGHYVTVYYGEEYKDEDEPGIAYAVVDHSKVVTVTEEDAANRTLYREAFGTKSYAIAGTGYTFDDAYWPTDGVTIGEGATAYVAGTYAPMGTYIIYKEQIVAYIEPAEVYASRVADISEFEGEETIMLVDGASLSNSEGNDEVVEYAGIAVKDYVTYVIAQGQYVLSPVDTVSGSASSITTNDQGDYVITLNNTEYAEFTGTNYTALTTVVNPATFDFGATYELYVTEDGKFIGYSKKGGGADVSNIYYVMGTFTSTTEDTYGDTTTYTYGQAVDTNGQEVKLLLAVAREGDALLGSASDLAEGFYSVVAHTGRDEKKEGIQVATPCGKGYDEDTNPLFVGANRWASNDTDTIQYSTATAYGTQHICNANCTEAPGVGGTAGHGGSSVNTTTAYYHSGTKWLVIDGEKGEALECSMIPRSSISYKILAGEELTHPMLFSRDDANNTQIELVVLKMDADKLAGNGNAPIYVADHQTTAKGKGELGYIYEVYDAQSGSIVEIVMNESTMSVGAGFYKYTIDDNDIYYIDADDELNQSKDKTQYYYPKSYFQSLYGGIRPTFVSGPSGDSASGAKVIDTRSDDEIAASQVARITSLDRIAALRSSGKVIQMAVAESNSTTIAAIYITDVISGPAAPEVVYLPVAADRNTWNDVIDANGNAKKIFVTVASSASGFVTYAKNGLDLTVTANANGENGSWVDQAITDVNTSAKTIAAADIGTVSVADAAIVDVSGNLIDSMADIKTVMDLGYTVTVSAIVEEGAASLVIVTTVEASAPVAHALADGDIVYAVDANKKGYYLVRNNAIAANGADPAIDVKKIEDSAITSGATNAKGGGFLYGWTGGTGSYFYASNAETVSNGRYAYKMAIHETIQSITNNGDGTWTMNVAAEDGHNGSASTNLCKCNCNPTGTNTELPDTMKLDANTVVVDCRSIPVGQLITSVEELVAQGEGLLVDFYAHRGVMNPSTGKLDNTVANAPVSDTVHVLFINAAQP